MDFFDFVELLLVVMLSCSLNGLCCGLAIYLSSELLLSSLCSVLFRVALSCCVLVFPPGLLRLLHPQRKALPVMPPGGVRCSVCLTVGAGLRAKNHGQCVSPDFVCHVCTLFMHAPVFRPYFVRLWIAGFC